MISNSKINKVSGLVGRRLYKIIKLIKNSFIMKSPSPQKILSETNISLRYSYNKIIIFLLQDPLVQENHSIIPSCSQLDSLIHISILVQCSRPKLEPIRLKILLIVKWKKEEKVTTVHLSEKNVSFLLMILTCPKNKLMELSLPFNLLGSILIIKVGMIEKLYNS